MGILEIGIFALYLIVCVIVLGVMVMHPKAVIGGVKKVLSKLPKRPKAVGKEINDFTDWKAYAVQGRKLKLEAHADWLREAYAILQPTCTHVYHQSDTNYWYRCVECQYVEPWEYKTGCRCDYHEVKNISDPTPWYEVTERQSFCPWHGTDFNSYPYSARTTVGARYGPSSNASSRQWIDAEGRWQDLSYDRSKAVSKGRKLRPVFEIKGTN